MQKAQGEFTLRSMPATPMTQAEMEKQCKLVSEVAKLEYSELDETGGR